MPHTEQDVHAFLTALTEGEGSLRRDNASGEFDEDAMWDKERAYMRRYYRKWYRPPWVILGDEPGSERARTHADQHRPFHIYKITPFAHPEYTTWVAAVSRPVESAPPYGLRFAVVELESELRIAGHSQACPDCYPDGGCSACEDGWLDWNEGNDKTKWLDALGEPRGPATRFEDPGERYAHLHERDI